MNPIKKIKPTMSQRANTSRDYYALNINDESTKLIIENSRDRIATVTYEKTLFTSEYEEKLKFYTQVKDEFFEIQKKWDGFAETIQQQDIIISAFTGFRNKDKPEKVLQRTIEKGTQPVVERGRYTIDWIKEAQNKLTEKNIFLNIDELWNFMLSDAGGLYERFPDRKQKTKYAKCSTFQSIITHCLKFNTRKSRNQILVQYENKIGLDAWVDDKGIPRAEYIKEFMYGENDSRVIKLPLDAERRASN